MMRREPDKLFEYCNNIFTGSTKHLFSDSFMKSRSARCIEIPWVISLMNKYNIGSLLDVGISLGDVDYIRFLMVLKNKYGIDIEGIDIINPERVKQRYPDDLQESICSLPIIIGDIRKIELPAERYDMISCISVIEHIGYDKASVNNLSTAFIRAKKVENIVTDRSTDTEEKVLNRLHGSLKNNGVLAISVPMGSGGPVILQDSLGYYCVQWEYEQESWARIINHPGYELIDQFFFKLAGDCQWEQVDHVSDLKDMKACYASHSTGCALALMKKRYGCID